MPLVVLGALFEAAGALATFGLLRLVVEPEQVRTAPVVSRLRAVAVGDPRSIVAASPSAWRILPGARGVPVVGGWVRQGIVYRSSAIAAERLLARYLAADYRFHVTRPSASLIQPMTRASDIAFELVAGSAVNILAEVVIIPRWRWCCWRRRRRSPGHRRPSSSRWPGRSS